MENKTVMSRPLAANSAAVGPSKPWLVLLAAFLGWMFDGMEMGIFPLVARPALQEMQAVAGVLDEQFVQIWMGRITALFLLGAAAGGLVFGWLGDRIGRVRAMTWSILAFRFIAALGMGGEWSLGVALVMECWPANKRPLMAGVIGAAANVGYALIAVLGIFFSITRGSWRWVMLVGAAPAVLTLLISFFVPESERWKASVKKEPSRPLREIFSPGLLRKTLLAISFASVALIVTWGIVQWIPLWADQMTHGQRPKVKAYIQLVSSLGAIVGCLIAPLIGGKFGRRPVYFGLCLSSFLICNVLFRSFSEYSGAFLLTVGFVGMCTVSHARPRHGTRTGFQLRPYPGRIGCVANGRAHGIF
jgi:MFS family permease